MIVYLIFSYMFMLGSIGMNETLSRKWKTIIVVFAPITFPFFTGAAFSDIIEYVNHQHHREEE